MQRRSLYYTINLILPCIVMSMMNILGFLLPSECGEKIGLGNKICLIHTNLYNFFLILIFDLIELKAMCLIYNKKPQI